MVLSDLTIDLEVRAVVRQTEGSEGVTEEVVLQRPDLEAFTGLQLS